MKAAPKAFDYADYRKFLKNLCEARKKANPRFSYRLVSQKAGLKSTGFFSWILSGKRNISRRLALDLAGVFKLGRRETEYFTLLVDFNQAKTHEEKSHYYSKMLSFKKQGAFKAIGGDQYEYYSQWYHSAVRELVTLGDFKENSAWIAQKLHPPIKPSEAEASLRLLKKLGLLAYNASRKLVQRDPLLWEEGNGHGEIRTLSLRAFHRQMIGLAREAQERFSPNEREISSLTVGISDGAFQRIKSRLTEFRRELLDEIGKDKSKTTRIHQINFQFFPLIQSPKQDERK